MSQRVFRLVISSAAVAVAFWTGRSVRGIVPTATVVDSPSQAMLLVGEGIPRGVVHSDSGSVTLESLFRHSRRTVLIAFELGCKPCLAEAMLWRQVALELHATHRFHGLACNSQFVDNSADVREFESIAALGFPVWSCDPAVKRLLRAQRSPTVYEVDPDGRVWFAASGDSASKLLEVHLRRRIAAPGSREFSAAPD